MVIEQNGSKRYAMVFHCRDTPIEQHLAEERKGCKKYYAVNVKLIIGQAKCPICSKRSRFNLGDLVSMSPAVHSGPYLDRKAAKIAADRLNGVGEASTESRPPEASLSGGDSLGV